MLRLVDSGTVCAMAEATSHKSSFSQCGIRLNAFVMPGGPSASFLIEPGQYSKLRYSPRDIDPVIEVVVWKVIQYILIW